MCVNKYTPFHPTAPLLARWQTRAAQSISGETRLLLLTEWRHWLTSVWWDNALQERDGSGNLLLRKETDDANHSQASVVDLCDSAFGLGFFRAVLGEAERIEEVEWDRVWDALWVVGELGVGTWCSSAHVVSSVGLGELLQEPDEEDDLPLGSIREGIPLLWRRTGVEREWRSLGGHWPRPVDAVGLHDVPDEGRHGNASVLDLGLSQESDGGLVAFSPDGGGGELQRIVVLQHRVGLLGDLLEVLHGAIEAGGDAWRALGGERGSAGDKGGSDSELHDDDDEYDGCLVYFYWEQKFLYWFE
mmetsp:Transcript_13970/g.39761  ORF Transcript_13970/g.39761 Transcript_13970/m.39761 type:complete len:302 (-) Transcript_13970:268-1173(-)